MQGQVEGIDARGRVGASGHPLRIGRGGAAVGVVGSRGCWIEIVRSGRVQVLSEGLHAASRKVVAVVVSDEVGQRDGELLVEVRSGSSK